MAIESRGTGTGPIDEQALLDIRLVAQAIKNGTLPTGGDGESAYELAVEQGYSGTLEQWLASLQGKDGVTTITTWQHEGYGPPPSVIPGAAPGDFYLDYTSGDIYELV